MVRPESFINFVGFDVVIFFTARIRLYHFETTPLAAARFVDSTRSPIPRTPGPPSRKHLPSCVFSSKILTSSMYFIIFDESKSRLLCGFVLDSSRRWFRGVAFNPPPLTLRDCWCLARLSCTDAGLAFTRLPCDGPVCSDDLNGWRIAHTR